MDARVKMGTKKARSDLLRALLRVSLFERFYARLISDVISCSRRTKNHPNIARIIITLAEGSKGRGQNFLGAMVSSQTHPNISPTIPSSWRVVLKLRGPSFKYLRDFQSCFLRIMRASCKYLTLLREQWEWLFEPLASYRRALRPCLPDFPKRDVGKQLFL